MVIDTGKEMLPVPLRLARLLSLTEDVCDGVPERDMPWRFLLNVSCGD